MVSLPEMCGQGVGTQVVEQVVRDAFMCYGHLSYKFERLHKDRDTQKILLSPQIFWINQVSAPYTTGEFLIKLIKRNMGFVSRRLNLNRANLVASRKEEVYFIVMIGCF